VHYPTHASLVTRKQKITLSTHLHEGDEDDEEGRRAARVVIGVELSVPFFREKFIADHADHPESRNISRSFSSAAGIIRELWLRDFVSLSTGSETKYLSKFRLF